MYFYKSVLQMKAMPITITRAFFFKLFKIDADLWFSIA